jgi:dTDP-4-dehydrorhamnose reductase
MSTEKPQILLLGDQGQVAWELKRALATLGKVTCVGRRTEPRRIDLSNPGEISALISDLEPDWIINAAAYTAVDKAEEEEQVATRINGEAPGILAKEAHRIGALLVHYSTDYVYDGSKDDSYIEADKPNPQSAYGRSKLLGDENIVGSGCAHLIFRTSWVYGPRGKNFLLTIRSLARQKEELRIIADQIGCPTSARSIAEATSQVLSQLSLDREKWAEHSGIYHLVSGGSGSWYDFASHIVGQQSLHEDILTKTLSPIATHEYPLPAARPANSVLDTHKLQKTFGIFMPDWRHALDQVLDELIGKSI